MRIPSPNLVIVTFIALFGLNCSKPKVQKPEPSRGSVYVTRPTLEPDKIASLWLLNRHVDKNATFLFVENDLPLTNGIPFDTPEAEFRRYANRSCFEIILAKHQLTNSALQHLGQIIHDLEINYWGQKRYAESEAINRKINEIIQATPTNRDACLEQAFALLDQLFERFQNHQPTPIP